MRWKPCLLALLMIVFTSERGAFADWRDDQEIWYDASELAKDVIIRNLDYAHKNRSVIYNPEFSRVRSSTLYLVLILDLQAGERANNALAELSAYGLDGFGAEFLQCAILRKGPVMIPLLRRELEKDESDCAAILGADSGVCLTRREHETRVGIYVRLIEDNSPCSFD